MLDMEGGGGACEELVGGHGGEHSEDGGGHGSFILVMDMEVDTVKDMAKGK